MTLHINYKKVENIFHNDIHFRVDTTVFPIITLNISTSFAGQVNYFFLFFLRQKQHSQWLAAAETAVSGTAASCKAAVGTAAICLAASCTAAATGK
jgi:hypothetical protein